MSLGDPLDGEHRRPGTPGHAALDRAAGQMVPGRVRPFGEAHLDLVLFPPIGPVPLHPFDVRHADAAGVREDVGNPGESSCRTPSTASPSLP